MPVAVVFIIFVVCLVIAIPVSISLGIVSVLPGAFDASFTASATYVIRSMLGGLDSFPLLAVPMFVLSGIIMAKGGISKKLFDVFAFFMGKWTAGMPCAVIVTCLFYGAISGSAPATVAAVGSMTIPILLELGYDKKFATAVVAVAGGLGVIIPPSIPFIMYGMASGASVSDLFLAGIIPGLLIGALLMVYAVYYCKKHGEDKEKIHQVVGELHKKGILAVLKESFFALLSPVIILGCIYSGVASPTEAAVISVFYALLVSMFVYKSIQAKDIRKMMVEAIRTFAPILFILATSVAFSRVLTLMQVPQTISGWILSHFTNPVVLLLVINGFLLLVGMVMDTTPAILILAPILLPIVTQIGMDPIQFGIIMVVNLAIGFVTPPIGVNLFVASSLVDIPVMEIAKKAMPMIAYFLIALLLITFVPFLSGCARQNVESEQRYAWPLATASPEDTVTQIYAEKFAEEVLRLSDGSMKIQVYPNSVLGGDRELLESCYDGDIPFVVQNTAPQVNFIPDTAVFDAPCAFDKLEDVRTVVDEPEFLEMMRQKYRDAGYELLGYSDQGFRVMSTNKGVETLSDFKGQKIRTMENSYHMDFWKLVDANPTPMSFSEVYIGLQQNTIDAQENPYEVIVSNRLYEQQDYVVETNHLPHLLSLIVSEEFFQGLSEEEQEILQEAGEIAKEYSRKASDERISERIETIEESGTQVIKLSDDLHQQLAERSQQVYQEIRENVSEEVVEKYLQDVHD